MRVLIDAAGTRYSWPRINHKLKDHSKLMIVDGHGVLLGSANWDARSLQLNFELSVEAYGRHFAEQMGKVIRERAKRPWLKWKGEVIWQNCATPSLACSRPASNLFFGTDDDKPISSFVAALTGTHSFPAGANGVGKGEFI